MWESTVEVTRKAVVQAAPEHAWALVSDSAAWSLWPGHFAFDVPQEAEAGRLRCWFAPFGDGLGCSVQEAREDRPGQVMSLLSRGSSQPGRQAFTLSVQPHDPGALVRLAVTATVPREQKADYQALWRKELKAWLSALADVADGRRPWPEAGIPAALQRACAGLPALTSPQGTSTAVLINAPPDVVWQAICAPGTPDDPRQPWTPICAGLVPGTPKRQAGEMRYVIVRHADGQLIASASMVRELAEGRSLVTQRLEPPHYEVRYRVAPAPGGTRLELTMCWPDAPVTDKGEQLRSQLTQALQQAATAYQMAIEAGGRSS
jgi:Polyketide cyclase / dehydrase and lipid transport